MSRRGAGYLIMVQREETTHSTFLCYLFRTQKMTTKIMCKEVYLHMGTERVDDE